MRFRGQLRLAAHGHRPRAHGGRARGRLHRRSPASGRARADELLPLLDQLIPTGKPLLILGEKIAGDALATLVVNKLRGLVTSVAVPTPEYGPQRRSMHEDLAILTGGIARHAGARPDAGQHPALRSSGGPSASSSTATRRRSSAAAATRRRSRSGSGRFAPSSRTNGHLNEYERDKLRERMARLGGRIAVIRVGAATETELAERMHRVQDAVQATRAALHEGILPGGGVALLNAAGGDRDGGARARRGDRRGGRPPRARGAAPPDRAQRRLRPVGRGRGRPRA